jgi:hypothetical protein
MAGEAQATGQSRFKSTPLAQKSRSSRLLSAADPSTKMVGTTAPPIMTAMAKLRPFIVSCAIDQAVDEARHRNLFYGADLVAQFGNISQAFCNASLKTTELIDDVI